MWCARLWARLLSFPPTARPGARPNGGPACFASTICVGPCYDCRRFPHDHQACGGQMDAPPVAQKSVDGAVHGLSVPIGKQGGHCSPPGASGAVGTLLLVQLGDGAAYAALHAPMLVGQRMSPRGFRARGLAHQHARARIIVTVPCRQVASPVDQVEREAPPDRAVAYTGLFGRLPTKS